MNMTAMRTGSFAAAAGLLLAALVGCAPEAAPTPAPTTDEPPEPTATDTPAPGPTPTATPTEGPFTIPACDDLAPLEEVRAAALDDVTLLGTDWTPSDVIPGTAAEAIEFATQFGVCVWGVDEEQPIVSVVVAELPVEDQDVLLNEISGTVYFEDTLDGADAFSRDLETDGPSAVTHLLIGDAWMVVTGEITVEDSRTLASSVLDSVRAANPGLG